MALHDFLLNADPSRRLSFTWPATANLTEVCPSTIQMIDQFCTLKPTDPKKCIHTTDNAETGESEARPVEDAALIVMRH